MSKKQRDLLQQEVRRMEEQRMLPTSIACSAGSHGDKTALPSSSELPSPFVSASWTGHGKWDTSCSVRPCPVPRTHPPIQSHHPEKIQTEAVSRKSCFRDHQPYLEHSRLNIFQRLPPTLQSPECYGSPNFSSCLLSERLISAVELDLLMQNVVGAYRETCKLHQESLQAMRWETFTPAEIQSFQQKTMDQMWERCVCHITDAIQYIVEFAKRLSGFMELNPNDQIVLLKAGAMELLLIRMSRAFNCYNSTIYFEGKYAPLDLFQSLGCNDLISAMFDLCHSLCALNLSEHEMAFFSSMVLLDPRVHSPPTLTGLSFMGTEPSNPHRSLLHGHRAPQPSQVSPSWAQSPPTLTAFSFMGTEPPNPHRSLLHGHRAPQPSQVSPSWAQSPPTLTALSFMGTEPPQPSQPSPSWAQSPPTLTGLSFMGTEPPNPHRSLLHGHRAPQPSQLSPSWAQSPPTLTALSFMGTEPPQPLQLSPSLGTEPPNPHRSPLHGHRAPQPSQVSPSWAQSPPTLTGLSFMGTEPPNPHRSLLHGHRAPQPSQLPQRGRLLGICQLHMEKLNIFRQMYPGIAWERFPPLYKELFVSDTESS
uniref:NR LBD domain-containing protein n=1 Tax=Xenopus tropicalis TaxID=8364 RepID=A0A1B8XYN0_XENTR